MDISTIFTEIPHRVLNDNHCEWIYANEDQCSSLSNNFQGARSIMAHPTRMDVLLHQYVKHGIEDYLVPVMSTDGWHT